MNRSDRLKRINSLVFTSAVLAAALVFIAWKGKPVKDNRLHIQFENFVGEKQLLLDSAVYTNEAGQTYSVSKFRYYISRIFLKKTDGSVYQSDQSFLVDEYEPGSKLIELKDVPDGNYSSIGFILGVDSLHNCSGAQSGDLDPVRGMFWAWNTGYIFLKIEGTSSASASPGHIFEFHIGGYRGPNNCIRTISLAFGEKPLKIGANGAEVNIRADISEIFKNPVTIDFAKLSSVTDFRHATMIADNYTDIFRITGQKP